MRKFKLIKEYPGSPEVGYIVYEVNAHHWKCSEYPEFWQEIPKPDYQILEFKYDKIDSVSYRVTSDENIFQPSGLCVRRTAEQLLAEGHRIHSVKRLSDGEIFTIGDRAKTITSKGSHNIRQFVIRQRCTGTDANGNYTYDGIDAMWVNWEENCGGNWLDSTEKVIEKDFEILLYAKKLNSNCTTTKRRGGENHNKHWKIYKVKRLSDGEIFTVGDKFKANIGGSDVVRTIQKIEVKGDVITIHQENGWLTNEVEYGGIFHEITKYVEPIFITEDGVEIFQGDSVYIVSPKGELVNYVYSNIQNDGRMPSRKYFSTKQAAQEYIRKNTPIFTTEDGVKIFKGDIYWFVDTDFSISMVEALHGCGEYSERKYFSTFELAEDYVIKNAKLISIEDFNNAIASQYGNYNIRQKLIQIAKQRLVKK